jgi:methionyl-tRNA formyltransferase
MNKNKFALIACTSSGRYILNYISQNKYLNNQFSGVINLDKDFGRKKSNYDCYSDIQEKFGFNIIYVKDINSLKVINFIKKNNISLVIQLGWSQKFNLKLLQTPLIACIGMHPSPLPIGRGAAVLNWAIILNKKRWGVSYFLMNENYDDGDILSQNYFKINKFDNIKTVIDKVDFISLNIFKKNIFNWTKGHFIRNTQLKNKITYLKRRSPDDGYINPLEENYLNIFNKIRALTHPFPGAFIIYKKKKIFIWEAKIIRNNIFRRRKNILYKNNKELFLATKNINYSLKLVRVQINNYPEQWGHEIEI